MEQLPGVPVGGVHAVRSVQAPGRAFAPFPCVCTIAEVVVAVRSATL